MKPLQKEDIQTISSEILNLTSSVDNEGRRWGHDTDVGSDEELSEEVCSIIEKIIESAVQLLKNTVKERHKIYQTNYTNGYILVYENIIEVIDHCFPVFQEQSQSREKKDNG